MILSSFRKAKWQHRDAGVRLAAVLEMTDLDQTVLATLAREDQDRGVRLAAIARLGDQNLLGELAGNGAEAEIAAAACNRRDQIFHATVLSAADLEACREALTGLGSQALLADLAERAEQPAVRLAAVEHLTDQELLAGLLENKPAKEVAATALTRIDREELLERVQNSASSKTIRRLAGEKLAALVAARSVPDAALAVDTRLHELTVAATRLGEAVVLDKAEEQLGQLQAEWRGLDPENTHPAAAAFTAACANLVVRLEEVRRRRAEEEAKAARYEEQQTQLEGLCLAVEKLVNSAAPEAPAEVKNLEHQWRSALAGESVPASVLAKRFEQAVRAFHKNREKVIEEQAQLSALTARLDEADRQGASGELDKAAGLLARLEEEFGQVKFKHLSAVPLLQRSKELARHLGEVREERLRENLARRQELCEQAVSLMAIEKLQQAEIQARELRQAWQRLPHLADPETEALTGSFNTAMEAFTEKLRNFEHERDWQLWANLTLKQDLATRVEALAEETELGRVVEEIKNAQVAWKAIGPVPQRLSQKLWERFHLACNRQYERCAPYLEEQKAALAAALTRKDELCVQAEGLADSEEWQKTAEAVRALQAEWKTLPVGPRHKENQLFLRFRKACNHFFERRQVHLDNNDESRRKNLQDKEKLCEEVERIVAAPRWNDAGRIRTMQGQWKKIGQAPKAHNDAIWERFRSTCDRYFAWLEAEKTNNLRRKEELCLEVEQTLAAITPETILKEVSAKLVDLQRQWKETGPIPDEQREALWQRFNTPCDEFFADRHRHFEEAEKARRVNQEKKEELLRRAEEQAAQGNNRQTAEAIQAIQKEWQQAGPAPKESERELNQRFKELCRAFFEGRRQHLAELEKERLENQRKKESLCLRLESLVGAATPAAPPVDQVLNLAEQLKMAMENNFMMAGRREEKATVLAEVKRLQEEWKKIGPADRKYEAALQVRFHQAYNNFARQNEGEKA